MRTLLKSDHSSLICARIERGNNITEARVGVSLCDQVMHEINC
jgi:hypothetical protein